MKMNQDIYKEIREEKKSKKGRVSDKPKSFGNNNDWKFDWFTPTEYQQPIVDAFDDEETSLLIIDAPSGTGKSVTAVYKALLDYKAGLFNKVMFVKTPAETSSDKLGYVSGDAGDKVAQFMQYSRPLFTNFMTTNKLENDIRQENIQLTVPNYLHGSTLDYTALLLDEAQLISPNILKMLMERSGRGTFCVVMGDSHQRYAKDKRPNGLKDLLDRVTDEDGNSLHNHVKIVRLPTEANMRSDLSRWVTEIYKDI